MKINFIKLDTNLYQVFNLSTTAESKIFVEKIRVNKFLVYSECGKSLVVETTGKRKALEEFLKLYKF